MHGGGEFERNAGRSRPAGLAYRYARPLRRLLDVRDRIRASPYAFVQLPIYRYVDGVQLTADWSGTVGISVQF